MPARDGSLLRVGGVTKSENLPLRGDESQIRFQNKQELTQVSMGISTMNYQRGVTSIEYALLATLIAIAIIVGVRATGEANKQSWINWTGKVIAAVEGALGL